jgi:hypothetical protein
MKKVLVVFALLAFAISASAATITSINGISINASYLNGASVTASQAVVGTNSSGQVIQPPSQTQNYFFAAPNGSSGNPSFRAIVAADIPTLNQNTSGTAAGLSGTPNISVGTISASGQITSSVAGGTAPFIVTSTTQVANLNAATAGTATSATTATNLAGTNANYIPYQSGSATTSYISAVNNAVLITNGSGVPSESTGLPNGITALGQVAGDNSTKVANTAYVDGKTAYTNPVAATNSSLSAGAGSGLSIAGSSLTAGSVYYQGASALALAEANSASTTPGICVAVSTTQCVYSGVYRFGTSQSWTVGGVLYLSDASSGALTQTAPTTSSHLVQRVGVALAADTMLIMPSLDVGGL